MRSGDQEAVAVVCGDLHFSHDPPVSRAETRDEWYEVQGKYLDTLQEAAKMEDGSILPILAAGDIFDQWNSPAELINFLIKRMHHQGIYAVPGNHDLPNHDMQQIQRTAYWTLVRANRIVNLQGVTRMKNMEVVGYTGKPDGFLPKGLYLGKDAIRVAVVHDYVWATEASRYPGASTDQAAINQCQRLKGFDAAIFGDNHRVVEYTAFNKDHPNILNCGAFIPRKSDEREFGGHYGYLYSDGTFQLLSFSVNGEKWRDKDETPATSDDFDAKDFIKCLKGLGDSATNFVREVKWAVKSPKVKSGVRKLILEILDDESGDE